MNENQSRQNNSFNEICSKPTNLVALYNSLSGNQYPLDTPVEVKVLTDNQEDYIYFVIDDKIVVLSEQSVVNENTPLRFFFLMSRFYETILANGLNKYARKLINLPRPEFYVLYNGEDDFPEEKTLKLSDAFKGGYTPSLFGCKAELQVKVVNINKRKV